MLNLYSEKKWDIVPRSKIIKYTISSKVSIVKTLLRLKNLFYDLNKEVNSITLNDLFNCLIVWKEKILNKKIYKYFFMGVIIFITLYLIGYFILMLNNPLF
jgi:hypothetical protein